MVRGGWLYTAACPLLLSCRLPWDPRVPLPWVSPASFLFPDSAYTQAHSQDPQGSAAPNPAPAEAPGTGALPARVQPTGLDTNLQKLGAATGAATKAHVSLCSLPPSWLCPSATTGVPNQCATSTWRDMGHSSPRHCLSAASKSCTFSVKTSPEAFVVKTVFLISHTQKIHF